MSVAAYRAKIASVGLAAVGVAGYILLADPSTPQTRELPTGETFTVLYGGATGLPANVCDGIPFEDCSTATGLERALCAIKGPGFVRNDDGSQYVDGFYRELIILPASSNRCIAKLRADKAQVVMMRQAARENVLNAPLTNAVNALRADPGFGRRYRNLPLWVRTALGRQRWAGVDAENDRTIDDEGVDVDGGLP
jgi:hypothetical protein